MAKAKVKLAAIAKTAFWQDDRKMAWLFFAIAFLLYAQTIGFGFALDDVAVTYENDFVKSGFNGFGKILHNFYWAGYPNFANANSGIFRPVSLLLFAVEWKLAPNSPHFYHFTNVLLFAFCAYQLYRLLRELLKDYSIMFALITTLIWLVLPIHVEVNANIKGADEILSFLFFLLSFRKLLVWNESGMLKDLLLSTLFIFLSLLSKEGAVLLIPVMLLGLILFRGKNIREIILPVSCFAVAGIIWISWHYWVIANASTPMITYDYRNNALLISASKIDQIGTAIGLQARYWVKMLMGFPLSYNYSFNQIPVDGFSSIWCWLSLAGIGFSGFFVLKNFRSNPIVSFAILFYFITFALTSNIFYIIGDIFADRLAFVPSLGFALLFAWLILKFTKGLTEKRMHAPAIYFLLIVALFYSIVSFSRSQAWINDATLYTTDVENSPNSARVHWNYGLILQRNASEIKDEIQKKQINEQAYSEFMKAYSIDSNDFQIALALAQINFEKGNNEQAIHWANRNRSILKNFFHVNPIDKSVYSILANAYIRTHKFDSCAAVLEEGLKIYPDDENLQISVGNNFLAQNDTASAILNYKKLVEQNPKSFQGWDKLANLYGMSGKFELSNQAFLEIVKLQPENPKPYQMLAINYRELKDSAAFAKYYQEYLNHGGK